MLAVPSRGSIRSRGGPSAATSEGVNRVILKTPIGERGRPPIEVGLSMQIVSLISFHSDGDGVPPITAVLADDSY